MPFQDKIDAHTYDWPEKGKKAIQATDIPRACMADDGTTPCHAVFSTIK